MFPLLHGHKNKKAGILWHVVITHRNPSISDVWVICDVFNLEKVDVHAESVFLPLLLSHCLVPSIAGLSRSVNTHLQILPPTLPFFSSSLLLISPYIWKNSSMSLCSLVFRRSASALARSILRILISATLWLRFCCSRLARRTATCLSRTSLQRSNLQRHHKTWWRL